MSNRRTRKQIFLDEMEMTLAVAPAGSRRLSDLVHPLPKK
ncbi:hypothetical protein RSK60_1950007 [Ralstonia solanacearum K60]|nr:hypothetical protein RSK60_1950007 [Ralstonia solanacearum K60]